MIDEIQNLDEYTMFVPVGDVTLSTPVVRFVVYFKLFSGIARFSVRISLAIYKER